MKEAPDKLNKNLRSTEIIYRDRKRKMTGKVSRTNERNLKEIN